MKQYENGVPEHLFRRLRTVARSGRVTVGVPGAGFAKDWTRTEKGVHNGLLPVRAREIVKLKRGQLSYMVGEK